MKTLKERGKKKVDRAKELTISRTRGFRVHVGSIDRGGVGDGIDGGEGGSTLVSHSSI